MNAIIRDRLFFMRLGINKAAQRLLQVVTSILKKNFKNKTKCRGKELVCSVDANCE